MSQDVLDDLLNSGSGGKPASFPSPGTTYEGELISMAKKQLLDFMTKQPETWPSGEDKLTYVIVLQTDQYADEDHDGRWAVYCRAGLHTALTDALQEAGTTSWSSLRGSTVKVQFHKTVPAKGNDRKVYRMRITLREVEEPVPEQQTSGGGQSDMGSDIPFSP